MAFKQIGSLTPHGAPVLRQAVITNSVVSTILDSLKVASGFAALGTAGDAVFGHLMSHVRDEGVGVETSGATGAESGSYVGTYTAASDNQTVGMAKAVCDISKFTLYSAEVDAAIGTTTGSDLLGYNMDLVDEDTLDESTATTGTAQYHNWGVDANDSTKAVVNIKESSVFGV
jgi:hypothetical protein